MNTKEKFIAIPIEKGSLLDSLFQAFNGDLKALRRTAKSKGGSEYLFKIMEDSNKA